MHQVFRRSAAAAAAVAATALIVAGCGDDNDDNASSSAASSVQVSAEASADASAGASAGADASTSADASAGKDVKLTAADGTAGMAMLVTQICTAMAALTWLAIEWVKHGKPSALGAATGAVAGLVAITPASGT
ncbi:MAG TPA: hypothetical protein PLC22_22435, partial [Gordonia sp. (in: high G+C Gram-positive bacteria)]|nr:hypothetical protein [Gordonia sp. (in: high G+C Gram-positive bacteria)]